MKPEHLKLLRDRFWRLNNLYFITDKQGNKVRFRRRRNRSITSKGCTHTSCSRQPVFTLKSAIVCRWPGSSLKRIDCFSHYIG